MWNFKIYIARSFIDTLKQWELQDEQNFDDTASLWYAS